MPDQTIIPHLVVRGAAQAIEFYKKAFGFEEVSRIPSAEGKLLHAVLRLGGQNIFLADEFGTGTAACQSPAALGGSPVTIHLQVANADTVYNQAIAAGAKSMMPPMDMFWGDRYAQVIDPFGHHWSMAHHIEDVAPAEIKKRHEAMFGNRPK